MDCFYQNKNTFRSDKRLIPILLRYYETIFIKHYKFDNMNPLIRKILKQLSRSTIDLKLELVKINVMRFRNLLDKL